MEKYSMNCPNCGGVLNDIDGLDTFFCKFCGSRIVLSGQSDAAYYAKTQVKDMEHKEKMADKAFEHTRYKEQMKDKEKKRQTFIAIAIPAVCILLIVFFLVSMKISSNNEEKELKRIVKQVQRYIEEEEFDKAYIKAQEIQYTSDWNSDIEEKWDKTRKELINQIIEEEIEKTGESKHKPEKDGWLSGLFN